MSLNKRADYNIKMPKLFSKNAVVRQKGELVRISATKRLAEP